MKPGFKKPGFKKMVCDTILHRCLTSDGPDPCWNRLKRHVGKTVDKKCTAIALQIMNYRLETNQMFKEFVKEGLQLLGLILLAVEVVLVLNWLCGGGGH